MPLRRIHPNKKSERLQAIYDQGLGKHDHSVAHVEPEICGALIVFSLAAQSG
eukprot:CAMPEP_0115346750 /NCGR_PEP_ID=MMETSP0270-20121206/94515_1 /TAXON_ID=71861 /ORGANISM="Scrippsiella trochoidea, Strain CCMP3099" /LENGTH=51 /DNA_ID=CAMNT_0002768629 /DNA_START=17 /DNA_END=168 /DNA_ORIENTATION=+